MDLTQAKIPYQPPVPPNSPDYQPSYDGYHDPNEDPSYKFSLKTPTYTRGETADSKGSVNGAFSYLDDVGKRHDVQYEAGSNTGFVVKTAFPDSDSFNGLFYQGPNKPGTPPRGHSSIVQNKDGSYQFTVSGPDQKRIEISDSIGRVRGSYTYIDDKGVQRTVHYIAGPNIGYKIVRKGSGPIYTSIYPYTNPEFLTPPFTDNSITNVNLPSSSTIPTTIEGNLFEPLKFSILKPEEKSGFLSSDDFIGSNNKAFSTSTFLPDILTEKPTYYTPSVKPNYYESFKPPKQNVNDFFNTGSNYEPSHSSSQSSTFNSNLKLYNDLFEDKQSEYDNSKNNFEKTSYTNSREYNKYEANLNRKPPNRYLYPKPDKNFKDELNTDYSNSNDNGFSGSSKNLLGLPPGVAVRAHIQSLDILPYGSKIPSPDEALQRHLYEEQRRDR
ncbi:hypothetical protein PGB90_001959 [Kerria lacca]